MIFKSRKQYRSVQMSRNGRSSRPGIHGPPGPGTGASWYEIVGVSFVLVRCGPTFQNFFYNWCGAVLKFHLSARTDRLWCVDPCSRLYMAEKETKRNGNFRVRSCVRNSAMTSFLKANEIQCRVFSRI